MENIIGMVPTNPVASLASGDMLQIIVFAVLLGVALTMMKAQRAQLLVDVFDRLNDAMIILVHIAMSLAPYGVGALLFKVAGTTGLSVLLSLGGYSLLVLTGLLLHVLLIYCSVLFFGARFNPPVFLRNERGLLGRIFYVQFQRHTAGYKGMLRTKSECEFQNFEFCTCHLEHHQHGWHRVVSSDSYPLHRRCVYVWRPLSCRPAHHRVYRHSRSVGAAGVPGAGIVTLAMVLTAINVPLEGIALILGVGPIAGYVPNRHQRVWGCDRHLFDGHFRGEKLALLTDAQDAADGTRGFEGRLD